MSHDINSDHVVTREVYRTEVQTVRKNDGGRIVVADVDIDDIEQSRLECSCGAVFESAADVEDHLS